MFPIVARSASGSDASPWPKYSTNFPTTPAWRRISVTVRTRSVAVAPSGSLPLSLKPTTLGTSIESGSPSIAASASIPPTPQPSTPSPFTIVVCESVPTSVSGKATPSRSSIDAGEVLEVDLVHDPRPRRHDFEVAECVLAPAQEGVALAVALELELDVAREGRRRAEDVHLHRVVDHELDRDQRVDLLGVAAEVGHRVSHRGEIDDGRDAREVLEQHAGGCEGDLAARLVGRHPAGDGLDVLARAVAEHVLEQDPQRVGEPLDVPLLLERVEPEDLDAAVADGEGGAHCELVGHGSNLSNTSRRRRSGEVGRALRARFASSLGRPRLHSETGR